MEAFVDRIIETDRKAREIILAAQEEKGSLLRAAEQHAAAVLAERAAKNETVLRALDAELAEHETQEMERADEAYLTAKHGLDSVYDANHDVWLREILSACTAL